MTGVQTCALPISRGSSYMSEGAAQDNWMEVLRKVIVYNGIYIMKRNLRQTGWAWNTTEVYVVLLAASVPNRASDLVRVIGSLHHNLSGIRRDEMWRFALASLSRVMNLLFSHPCQITEIHKSYFIYFLHITRLNIPIVLDYRHTCNFISVRTKVVSALERYLR